MSHIESHHHVHTVPWMMGNLIKLARQQRVPAIRRSMDLYYDPEVCPPRSLLMKKHLWNSMLPLLTGAKTSQHFTSFSWFLKIMTSGIGNLKIRGTIELMCHPGGSAFQEENKDSLHGLGETIGAPVCNHDLQ